MSNLRILIWLTLLAVAGCASASSSGADRAEAQGHYDKAVAFYAKAQYEDAIEEYQLALQDWPDYVDAHAGLGVSFIKTGFYRGAVLALERAIRLRPEEAETYLNLGIAQAGLGRHPDAIVSYRLALDRSDDLASAWFSLGQSYLALSQPDSSVGAFRRAASGLPYRSNVTLADVYMDLGDSERAIDHLRLAAAVDSTRAEPWIDIGGIYESVGAYDQAIEAYLDAVDRDESVMEGLKEKLAGVYAAVGRNEEAASLYEEILEANPVDATVLYNLAVIYDGLGRHEEAVAHYRRSIEIRPAFPDAYLNLAIDLMEDRDFRGALEAYEGYLRNAPEGEKRDSVEEVVRKLRAALGVD